MTVTHEVNGIGVGDDSLEGGEGVVIIKMGPLVYHLDPPTARGIAIALIHHAEVAGLPPPTDAEMDDLFGEAVPPSP